MKILFILFLAFCENSISSNFDIERPGFVEKISRGIRAGMTFGQALGTTAAWRREVSLADNRDYPNHFGQPRDRQHNQRSFTVVMNYPIIQLLLQRQLTELRQGTFVEQTLEGRYERPASYEITDNRTSVVYVGGRVRSAYNPAFEMIISPVLPDSLVPRAEEAFREALMVNTEMDLLHALARLHYWVTVAAPYLRGTASIAEIIVEAVALVRGFTLEYPERAQIVQTIGQVRGIPDGEVSNRLNSLTTADSFASLGRQSIDQFAHGSESVDEFVRFYERLVTLIRPAQPEADNATSACKCSDNMLAEG